MVCSQSATLISIALLQAWCVQKHTSVFLSPSLQACRWAQISSSSIEVLMQETENKSDNEKRTSSHCDQSVFDVGHFYHRVLPSQGVRGRQSASFPSSQTRRQVMSRRALFSLVKLSNKTQNRRVKNE